MNTHLHVWRVPRRHRENLSASDLLLYIYATVGTALQFPPLDKRADFWGVEEQGPLGQILRHSQAPCSVITLNIFILENTVWTSILWTTMKWNRVLPLWCLKYPKIITYHFLEYADSSDVYPKRTEWLRQNHLYTLDIPLTVKILHNIPPNWNNGAHWTV